MRIGPKIRGMIVCVSMCVCFTAFSARLIHLQVGEYEKYRLIAAKNHGAEVIIPASRGVIRDINNETLADNDPQRRVVADGSRINKPAEIAELLAKPLGMRADELEQKLRTKKLYVRFKPRLTESDAAELAAQLQQRGLHGISFEPDAHRFYPNGQMLAHVIGYTTRDDGGKEGIEKTMESDLRGHDGSRVIERDRTGRELVNFRGLERKPENGNNVQLTINVSLQQIVEEELEAACRQFKPKTAVGIVMRPQTGEILALASRPTFDPNRPGDFAQAAMQNHAIIDRVEPGSTFKIVTASAALNENLVDEHSMIFCDWGRFQYGGRTLRDHGAGHGDLSVEEILVKSSNIGAAHLALRLKDQKLYEYARRFGFGDRTGIALPNENTGFVRQPHTWDKVDITRIAIGQAVDVTPLQAITAMCAIANGGHLMMPQIVHEITDEQGGVVKSYPPVEIRQAVSEKVANQVRKALVGVVSTKGTAALAKVTGYTVFGKTGTAQKVDQRNPRGGYMPGKYVLSFVGGLPAEDPQFVCLVMLDEAQTKAELYYGGQVAAPVFSRIAEKVARYMGIPAHEEPTSKVIITNARSAGRSHEGTRD